MLRIASLALVAGLALLSIRSFADVTGLWPLPSAGPSGDILEAAHAQLRTKPIDGRAFYALGRAAEDAGNGERAELLYRRSVALDPRLPAPRLSLMTRAASEKGTVEAVRHARVLATLSPQAAAPISMVLADLARDRDARRVIGREAKDTPLILAVASRASANGLAPSALRELLAPTDLGSLPNGVTSAQSLIVAPFVRDRRFAEARQAWYALAGLRPESAVFDGAFSGLAGSPPFGWTLRNGTDVEAAVESEPGSSHPNALRVTAFGSLQVVAAEQTVVLRAGQHRLEFEASVDAAAGQAPAFAWRVTCGNGPLIAEVPIALSRTGWQKIQATFDVPGGCPSQVLRLTKLRTPDARARTLEITNVVIHPL